MSRKKMSTVCLLGSPRRDCNSDTLAFRFIETANKYGGDVETHVLSELSYSGCQNLFRCKKDLDHCGQLDDLTPILDAIAKSEVLVMASPVYFTSITGQLKLALDRFFSFFVPDYPTAETKSRLSSGRHFVLLQTQGEPEVKYADLLASMSVSLKGLGFDNQHLVRAWGVRNQGDIASDSIFLEECDLVAERIYGN